MDYDSEGGRFVAAGKDTAVRVYDEATKVGCWMFIPMLYILY